MNESGLATINIKSNKLNREGEPIISDILNNYDNVNNDDNNRESTIRFHPRNKLKQGKTTISDNARHIVKAYAIN